jgi:DNA-binding NtrC family response regulator/tetratricopeptide (TPR) repeat protein
MAVEVRFRERLSKIKQMLSCGEAQAAFDALGALGLEIAGCEDCATLSSFHALTAESYHQLGDYSNALVRANSAIRLSRQSNDRHQYANQKYLLGRILQQMGKLLEAAEEYTESYAFFRSTDDYRGLLGPLGNLASLHYVKGEYRRALEVLQKGVVHCLEHDLADECTKLRLNLCRVLFRLGRFADSLELIATIERSSDSRQVQNIATNIRGMILTLLLDRAGAISCLNRARAYYAKNGLARDEIVCIEYLGLNEYFSGNHRRAREYYSDVLGRTEITGSASAQTLRMLADVYVAEGNFKKGSEIAARAKEAISKINERIELGALYRVFGQIRAGLRDETGSRDYFCKSFDLLGAIGALYELALSHLACGARRGVFGSGECLRHLQQARDLFEKMNVPRRVKETDQAVTNMRSTRVTKDLAGRQGAGAPTIIVASLNMKKVMELCDQVAKSELNVLLTGETGTGKDLFASHIHYMSGRPGRFITVNAAAIPTEMIESELFGYKKGAFTGAIEEKPGRFELADKGTFYLNEVADASPQFQAKLLEVIETGHVWRLGESRGRKVNFRLVAATNRDPHQAIQEGSFRADLFHRLREAHIELPALRDRVEDMPALVKHFLSESDIGVDIGGCKEEIGRLSAIMALREYPGNVRDLSARLRELFVTSGGLLSRMVDQALESDSVDPSEQLVRILKLTAWNRTRAAWILGVSEGTIRHRIKKYKLTSSES